MDIVTVFNTFSPAEAHLIRSRLEAAGLHAYVAHEVSALTLEGYSMAAGGIRVQVPDNEVEDARALITSANSPNPEPQ